jgi:hypothetical protein
MGDENAACCLGRIWDWKAIKFPTFLHCLLFFHAKRDIIMSPRHHDNIFSQLLLKGNPSNPKTTTRRYS